MRTFFWSTLTAFCLTATQLSGCGGGGSTASTTPTPTPTPASETTLSGNVVKGPVNGGIVTVSSLSGTVLGTTTTSPAGTYTLRIAQGGDVVVVVQGGTYTDEATGLPTTLNQLKAVVSTTGGTQTVHLTPLTYLAYVNSGNTVAGFNTAMTTLANQFGLASTNLLTTVPTVSGATNDYGRVLRAVSQYVRTQGITVDQFISRASTTSTFAGIQANFASAFNSINPGQTLTFSFNSSGATIGGTGAGGGTGTCGVNVVGSISANGFNVPLNLNYCVSGIAAGSCTAGNSSLNQALNGQQGIAGAANLNYTFNPTCTAGALNITLQ
jgi:hypothetical protein